MNPPIYLQSGSLRCELRADLGGCVAGLWCGQHEVLRSTAAARLQSVRLAASYPLVPYSNRVANGQLRWAGSSHPLLQNFAPEPHSIHGVGWERPWVQERVSAIQAELAYEHQADAAWPFAFDSQQTFSLSDQALEMRLSVTNRAPGLAPVGLGWHPYFAKSAQTHIQFQATGRWEMGADKLPTERLANAGLDSDCGRLDVDHCFDGWSGKLSLREGKLCMRISSDLDCLVVFTTPERDSIAIEPVSHVNNALALAEHSGTTPEALGMRLLQSGETFSACMRIEVEALA